MKDILLVLAVLAALITGVEVFRDKPSLQKEAKHVPTTEKLQWFAQQAKNEGKRSITIPSRAMRYSGDSTAITLDEALKISTVVLAQLVDKKSYNQSGNNIVTWNKFRIKEVLSEAQEINCPQCPWDSPPQEMLPLKSQEFLLSKSGGRLTVEGVDIEQVESGFPEFQEHRVYLLFLTLRPTGVAETIGGPVGVFRLNDKGNALPLNESPHLIKKGFKQRFANSPEGLKTPVYVSTGQF